ncbi:MAG: AsmA-like C-terminal region-containing protein [Candidatus Omnitrophota bacterium]
MKRALIIIAIVLVAISVAIAAFIATFDISAYKGLIESRLERLTGNKVEIGRLSMKIRGGSAVLEAGGLRIYTGPDGDRTVLLSCENLEALVELAPLLARSLRLSRVFIDRPEVLMIRSADRSLVFAGHGKAAGISGAAPAAVRPAPKPFGINIGSIEIRNGILRFRDMAGGKETDVTARKMDIAADNVSASGTERFTAKMDVECSYRDMVFSGALDIKAGEFEMSAGKLSKFAADISMAGGRLSVSRLKMPVDKISLSAAVGRDSVTVNSFSASLASGTLSGSGRADDIFGLPREALNAAFEVRGIKDFVYSALGQKQSMDGNMRLTFEGTMKGLAWPEISKTLAGAGEFYLDRGRMTNTNVLNQALGSLTQFPGLPDMVRGYLPAPVQQVFGDNDTAIEPLRQAYTIEDGYVLIPDLNLKTDTFEMRGEAKSSLTGDISGSGMIRFARSVSEAMLKAAPEMKYITDSQGMVEFPMAFKSGDEGFKVIPDIKYVGKKVAVQKAGEIIGDLFQKTPEGAVKAPKLKDLVKSFMEEGRNP